MKWNNTESIYSHVFIFILAAWKCKKKTQNKCISKMSNFTVSYYLLCQFWTVSLVCKFTSPDQFPKSATLPKWVMLFLIRQAQIQNNPIMHCFNWNNLLFVCWFWASNRLKFIMFWTYLDYWIHVTIIVKQNNMFCFVNKNFWKTVKFEF